MKLLYRMLLIFAIPFFFSSNSYSQDFDFFQEETTVGGYGELHYNYVNPDNGESKRTLDFHRFVIFIGHGFSEQWSFKSEIELEHNFVADGEGELELEQAYINYHHAEYLGLQAGVILPSAGLTNEYHEPPLFLGVERPDYAKYIIPTTWFGSGIALYGFAEGFDYKFTVMEGLNADKFSASSGIRSGRQKGFKSNADDLLYNIRVNYLNIPGLKIGASYSYNNAFSDSIENQVSLAEFHAQYIANYIYAVFEFGNISYSESEVEASRGYYFDFGYDVGSIFDCSTKIIPFVRYTDYNTAAETVSGGDSEKIYHYTKWMAGISVKPMDSIVLKADFSIKEQELGKIQTKLLNLGVGYMF